MGDEQRFEDPQVTELCARVAALLGLRGGRLPPVRDDVQRDRVPAAHPARRRRGDPAPDRPPDHRRGRRPGGVRGRDDAAAGHAAQGMFSGDDVRGAMRYPDRYSPRSRLVSRRADRRTWPAGASGRWRCCAAWSTSPREHGLRLHMDGARLMNAVVASGVPAAEMTAGFDTAWLDFTKGLGAPLGAVPGRLGRADRRGLALQADARRRDAPGGHRRRRRAVRARPQRRAARGGSRERRGAGARAWPRSTA